jgi:hypothetical protein
MHTDQEAAKLTVTPEGSGRRGYSVASATKRVRHDAAARGRWTAIPNMTATRRPATEYCSNGDSTLRDKTVVKKRQPPPPPDHLAELLHSAAATEFAQIEGGLVQLIGVRVKPDAPVAGKRLLEIGRQASRVRALVVAIGGVTTTRSGE